MSSVLRFIGQLLLVVAILTCLSALAGPAVASPEFSGQTGQSCAACHKDPKGGGALNLAGERYKVSGYFWGKGTRPDLGVQLLRLVLGFIHVLAGVIWFGSIVYVHLIIKPASLVGGMPPGEKRLGRICLMAVGLTGIGLTLLKLHELRELWTTSFGLILLVKMFIYVIMVAVAAVATTYIDRLLRRAGRAADAPKPDGQEGRPAHVFYAGRAYDVSQSKLWKNGVHMARHHAGVDLTEAIEAAPHGPEVLQRVPDLGPAQEGVGEKPPKVLKLFVALAYFILFCVFLVLLCVAWWNWGPPLIEAFPAWTQSKAQACLNCHAGQTHAIVDDWNRSAHARNRVSCLHCHQASPSDPDVSAVHASYGGDAVSAVVSPKDCGRCHLDRVAQFSKSKHARTVAILAQDARWRGSHRASLLERETGCAACHGAASAPDGSVSRGIGRVNPDGSRGNCAACHGRHVFTPAQARRAEACVVCHVGPEHPQSEIFRESKHGSIYLASGRDWSWGGARATWTAGLDYRTPTCAACHICGAGQSPASHDVGHRLAWELQASPTVRPRGRDWRQARRSMQEVCRQCHAAPWIKSHFIQLDRAVDEYNRAYHQPLARLMAALYDRGVLSSAFPVDEPLEAAFDEMGRREGRRAKMGAAMMAPDYAWWHGFYELKKRFTAIGREAARLLQADSQAKGR